MPGPRFPLSVALPNGRVRHAARPAAGGRVTTLCRRGGIPTGDGAGLPYCARCRDRPNPIDQRSLTPTAGVAPADAAVTGTSPAGQAAERVAAFLDAWHAQTHADDDAPIATAHTGPREWSHLTLGDLRALLAERDRLGDPQHTAATPGQPTTAPTTHTVSCLPEDDRDAHSWHVTVEYRGGGRWAVQHFAYCLGTDGEWDYEPSPSNRDGDWLATHRFDFDTALRLATEAAPGVTVNGLTPAGYLAWRARHDAAAGGDGAA